MSRYQRFFKCVIINFIAIFALGVFQISFAADSGLTSSEIKTLKKQMQVLADMAEIQNVMSKHAYYYSSGQHRREIKECWAMNMPDVCFGQDEGYWVGPDNVNKSYGDYFDYMRQRDLAAVNKLHPEVANTKENWGAGTQMFHSLTTPIIEVAGDGKTAKAIWFSPGYVSQTPGGVQDSMWMWERYGVDFVKVDGSWKIWHLRIYTDFSSPRTTMGAGGAPAGQGQGGGSGAPAGQGQGTTVAGQAPTGSPMGGMDSNKPALQYVPEGETNGPSKQWAVPQEIPKVPVPYETFSETFSYGPPEKSAAKK